jgi:hypothetical protein
VPKSSVWAVPSFEKLIKVIANTAKTLLTMCLPNKKEAIWKLIYR